jgi:hypothetical protein
MSEIEDLQLRRKQLWTKVHSAHILFGRAGLLYQSLQTRYNNAEKEYEKCDIQLSMLDGRYKVVEPATHEREKKEPTMQELVQKLTEQEIDELLQELKVEMTEVEKMAEFPIGKEE